MFREKCPKLFWGGMVILAFTMVLTLSAPAAKAETAQNVILLIGDGMQLEHEIAAGRYFYGNDYGMAWYDGSSYDGYVATWDVDTYDRYASDGGAVPYAETNNVNYLWGYNRYKGGDAPYPVDSSYYEPYFLDVDGEVPATDSASAATAMATGLKTDGGNIAWATGDPDGGSLTTIAERFRANGRSIGVTSTVPFTHATPAAFVSHNVYRNNYSQIAHEIVNETMPDVVIGGGYGSSYYGYTDSLVSDIRSNYTYVERTEGVDGNTSLTEAAATAAASGGKLFGLFGNSSGGNFDYATVTDTPGSPTWERGSAENPDMATSVTAALDVLSTNENGFFLMAEQGDIDWANHANNFNNMIGCMYDLDQATRAVYDYINQGGDNVTWDNTLVIVTTDHANSYMRLNGTLGAGDLPDSYVSGYSSYGDEILAYTDGSVTYGTGGHTNELVTLHAAGAGSGLFGSAEGVYYSGSSIIDNTQIYDVMMAASGI